MIISSFAWIWAAIIGGVVFTLATHIPLLDGVFESLSALTGTGITMFNDVEILPHSILFFRAFEQWIGGLGVVVMVIGVLTKPGSVSSTLYHSEPVKNEKNQVLKPHFKKHLKSTAFIPLPE
jgi:trk system potassium uptake protein TrkH